MCKNLKNRTISRFFSSSLNVMLACEHSELPRASRSIKAIFLNEANSTTSRLFSVIFGLVPKILLQQVTNLVNKFTILLKRSMFIQDCRNASGNDGCWGRGLSLCCKFLNRMYRPGSSANELSLKAKDDYKSTLQQGRSMIEMLGVLAIIGILSVGGIAGYSKAMTKFKINKIVHEYNMLVQGLIEVKPNLKEDSVNINNSVVFALNLVPQSWRSNGNYLYDSYGNFMTVGYRSADNDRQWDTPEKSGVYIDYFLGTLGKDEQGVLKSESFSDKICFELFSNVIKPLHNVVNAGWVNSGIKYYSESFYYGDAYCSGNRKCLKDISLDTIKTICGSCDKIKYCNVTIIF